MNNNDLMRQVAAALFVERMRHAGVHRVETDADDVQKVAEWAFSDALHFINESLEWLAPDAPAEVDE